MLCSCHIRGSWKSGRYLTEAGEAHVWIVKKFAFMNSNTTKQTACFVQGELIVSVWNLTGLFQKGRIIFPIHCACKSIREAWIPTSVLKQLCHLVLRGSGDTVEWAQLGQSLHEVSALSIQSAYSDSCHCKVLQTTRWSKWKRTVKANSHSKKQRFHCAVSRDIKSLTVSHSHSSAQFVPCSSPTLHASSVGRANWNKSTSLAVKRLSSATMMKGLMEQSCRG